ncbi:nucleotidyltransferase [Amycolatopsis azurea]|uniref:SMODS domain-containing nucleotidyltransferase n=1 Tax=Amycolatopsis azurea TaxID=36819 RepID=UPI0037F189EF
MATTASEGFNTLLGWLTPTDSERAKAASHRQSIEDKLESKFGVYRMFESGSFKHGTGVSGHSDVDYFVSLKSNRPMLSDSTLSAVRSALQDRFPFTRIHVERPAVVLEFGQGYERVEVIPAYAKERVTDKEVMKFNIPGVVDEWLESTPEAHADYVNGCNKVPKGGAKELARLVKAWKYYRNVPISSFYLEMRAAQYMEGETFLDYPQDIKRFLSRLQSHDLAAMNDPTGYTGRINACSTDTKRNDALSKLNLAVTRVTNALEEHKAGDTKKAFEWWDKLFGGHFPGYY